MICAVVMTDGRRTCIKQAVGSLERQARGTITRRVIHDDSGDAEYQRFLHARYGDTWEIISTPGRSGFGGAYRSAWVWLAANVAERFVFSTEDDFTYNLAVDLDQLARVLDTQPNLVQLALRRQAWSQAEVAAGGVIEQHPEAYADVFDAEGHAWLEHRQFFTTNPSLFRTALCCTGWPDVPRSEGILSHRLMADSSVRFGFWGRRGDRPWVHHIGQHRKGTGY